MKKRLDKKFETIYVDSNNLSIRLDTRIIQEMPKANLNNIIVIISAAGIIISLLLVVLLGRLKRPGLIMT